jgi:hypothetical protein
MANNFGLFWSLSAEIPLRGGVSITDSDAGAISEWIYERFGVFSVFRAMVTKDPGGNDNARF